MARLTNAQLLAENASLRASMDRMAYDLAAAQQSVDDLNVKLMTQSGQLPTAARAPRQLPAHFIAAREAAMRMGRSVKVAA